jgi:hypothetical protein
MPQIYRLRLGDGTILKVDYAGLSTWETDPTAAVGTRNPNKWLPLKEFLIQERAEAFRRAREGTPEPPPTDTPTTVREDGLPLTPPPPPREDAWDHPAASSPPDQEMSLPSPAKDTIAMAESGPWPRRPAEGRFGPRDEVTSLALPAPAEEPIIDGGGEPEDLFVPEAPLTRNAGAGSGGTTLPEPAEPAPAVIAVEAHPVALPSQATPAVPVAEEIDLEPLAAEAMTAASVTAAPLSVEKLPVIPLRPQDDDTPLPQAVPNDPVAGPAAKAPRVQALADDPASAPRAWSRRARVSEEAPERPEPVRLPVLVRATLQWTGLLGVVLSRCLAPINRLEHGLPLFGMDIPGAPLESRASPGGEISLPTFELDFGAVRSRTSNALGLDAIRSRASVALRELPGQARLWLGGLASQVAGLSARGARSETPFPSEEPAALPLPVLQPLEESAAPSFPAAPPPSVVAEEPSATPAPMSPPSAVLSEKPPAAAPPSKPRPRQAQPPPEATALPALRLAPIPEPRSVGDVYAGDEGGSVASSIRLWTKRVVLTATVLAGAGLAGLHWDTWAPAAENMGGTLFSEIDDRVRWLHLARERQAVIDQASEQFPHLARDTVGLILSTNRTHVLEPPAVFETAWGAAERGASTLSASEAEELESLRQQLYDELPPLDQERLRTFGRAYAQGAVFTFDARRGLLAYARGARALPPDRRARLQTLLGKAIAAGLTS